MRKIKSLAVHIAVAVTLSVTGVAVAASFSGTPSTTEQTQGANTQPGGELPALPEGTNFGPPEVVPTNEPEAEEPTEVVPGEGEQTATDEPASITPEVPTNEPEPQPEPAPAPVYATSKTMRFVDVSSEAEPNSKAQQWCDYTYSNGTSGSKLKSTLYKQGGFAQPISSYSSSNPPGVVSGC